MTAGSPSYHSQETVIRPTAGGDYTPIFIGQILDTVGGHFDRHQSNHYELDTRLARIEQKVDHLMADLATALNDLTQFVADVKGHFGDLQAAVADLTAKLASAGNVNPDVQAAADRIEQVIADGRATIDAAPSIPAPVDPSQPPVSPQG